MGVCCKTSLSTQWAQAKHATSENEWAKNLLLSTAESSGPHCRVVESDGKGILFSQSDSVYYEGQIRDHQAHGQGVQWLKLQNGYEGVYKGEFQKNQRSGRGEYSEEGLWFSGEWKDGIPQKGKLKIDGLELELRSLKYNPNEQKGVTSLVLPDRSEYEGEFGTAQFCWQGRGFMKFSNGCHYEGSWEEGVFHGQGTYVWADNTRYEGEFKKGQKHGEGRYYLSESKYMKGRWEEGKKEGIFEVLEGDQNGNYVKLAECKFNGDKLLSQSSIID